MMRRLLLAMAVVGCFVSAPRAACMDHGIWDKILKANVDKEGFVDYDAIRVNKGGDLYEYIAFLEDADLTKCTDSERAAFWTNAYNAHTIRIILARPQLKQISDDFKLFSEPFKVARANLSLNDIEHRILRASPRNGGPIQGLSVPNFDPRLHFALVCGAIGCPRLLNKAYVAATLNDALQAAAVQFGNNPKHLRVENDELVISSLLRWYAEDFNKLGGARAYLISLTDPALRPDAAAVDAKLGTDFPDKAKFKYDWTLNSVKNKPK